MAALAASRAGAGRAATVARGPARRLTRRAASTAAGGATSPASLFAGGRVALLERPPTRLGEAGAPAAGPRPPLPDDRLWRTGAFAAQVHPDLPAVASVKGWARSLLAGGRGDPPLDAGTGGDATAGARDAAASSPRPWVVRTVAAQTRSLDTLERRLAAAAAGLPGVSPPADALLLVSGGDPARRLGLPAWAGGARTDSVAMLQAASRMRAAGVLPPGVALWAVANPLTEAGAGRAAAKVGAGAAALLTQPPLGLWGAWEAWYADADRLGVPGAAALVAGLALPTTPAGFAFWVGLAGAGRVAGVRGGVAALGAAASAGKGAEHAFQTATAELDRLASMPGIAGVHVMPVSAGGRGVAERLVGEGRLAGWGGGRGNA